MDYIIKDSDLLIIGGGLAGLSSAMEASKKNLDISIAYLGQGASSHIMGFNTPVGDRDSTGVYLKDTIESGYRINNYKLASALVNDSKIVLKDLESIGISFDKEYDKYYLMQTLSCSFPRLVVHNKNQTGAKAIKLFKEKIREKGVKVYDSIIITHLVKEYNMIVGAYGFDIDRKKPVIFKANAVVLSTGGCCGIYSFSTNSLNAIGDGYAMAYDIGAELVDMEFIQFEPCIAVHPKKARGKGLVTILFNEGGRLYNSCGERFMFKYCREGESTHKDVLAKSIYKEIKEGRGTKNGGVYFDISNLPNDLIEKKYNTYLKRFQKVGIDIRKEPLEVAPAAHTSIGGLKIDNRCQTSIEGLYACGEVAGGIHGANRIGGNAGTEVFVFGRIAGISASEYILENKEDKAGKDYLLKEVENIYNSSKLRPNGKYDIEDIEKKIKKIISENANVIREDKGLKKGLAELEEIKEKVMLKIKLASISELAKSYRLYNMITVAEIIMNSALTRKESRGTHCREDYPKKDDKNWLKNIIVKKVDDIMKLSLDEVVKLEK